MTGTAKNGWVFCQNCDNTGLVCENHPDRPFTLGTKRPDACECGPGMPCPVCIEYGEMPDPSRAYSKIILDGRNASGSFRGIIKDRSN